MAAEDYSIQGLHNAIEDRRPSKRFGRLSRKGIIAVQCAIAVDSPDLHGVIEDILLHDAYRLIADGEEVNVGAASPATAVVWKCNLWVPSDDVSIQGLTKEEAEIVPNEILAALNQALLQGWRQAGIRINVPRQPYKLTLVGVA